MDTYQKTLTVRSFDNLCKRCLCLSGDPVGMSLFLFGLGDNDRNDDGGGEQKMPWKVG